MLLQNIKIAAVGLSCAIGLGAVACLPCLSLAAAGEGKFAHGSLACEIAAEAHADMVLLKAVVIAEEPVEGRYRFEISKDGAGTAQIEQSGLFLTERGEPHRVGMVTLGGDGGPYRARLEITADGETIQCEEQVGGLL